MKSGRQFSAVAGLAAVGIMAFSGTPAGAATAEVYLGTAKGQALVLSVPGQAPVTFGLSQAKAASDLTATATGQGEALIDQTKTGASIAGGGSDSPAGKCANSSVANPVSNVLTLGLACSTASASIIGGLAKADSMGQVAGVDVKAQTILSQIPIGPTLAQVFTTLDNLAQPLSPVTNTLASLTTSLLNTQTLAATFGNSTSNVTTSADKVITTATSAGSVIKILPTPTIANAVSQEALATITIGAAKATTSYDRLSGVSTPSWEPALVRVKLNSLLATQLGLPQSEFTVPVSQTQTILSGTPLESTIVVADGSLVKDAADPNRAVGAVADGVSLQLLKGIGETTTGARDGGITLRLAHAESGATGVPATADILKPPTTPLKPAELPRTGGTPWVPMAGAGVLALALAVRRSLVRAR